MNAVTRLGRYTGMVVWPKSEPVPACVDAEKLVWMTKGVGA